MAKQNNKAIIHPLPLVLVGIVIIVVAGAFYFGRSSQTPLITKQEDQSMIEDSSTVPSEMDNWEVYEEDGFRFKYPKRLSLTKAETIEYMHYSFLKVIPSKIIP